MKSPASFLHFLILLALCWPISPRTFAELSGGKTRFYARTQSIKGRNIDIGLYDGAYSNQKEFWLLYVVVSDNSEIPVIAYKEVSIVVLDQAGQAMHLESALGMDGNYVQAPNGQKIINGIYQLTKEPNRIPTKIELTLFGEKHTFPLIRKQRATLPTPTPIIFPPPR